MSPPPAAPAPTPTPALAPAPADPRTALQYDEADPLADLEAADAIAAPLGPLSDKAAPTGGCVALEAPRRLWPEPAQPVLAASGDGFVLAGHDRKGGVDRLFVLHAPADGAPRPLMTMAVQPPHGAPRQAPPALMTRGNTHALVAYGDGEGSLWLRELSVDRPAAALHVVRVSAGMDTRFAPSLEGLEGRTLIAWTQGSTPMRSHLAVYTALDREPERHVLNTPAHGAAAATFVRGAGPPRIVMVDARDGMSSMLSVSLSGLGVPGPMRVAVPVGMVSSPPRLAAASGLAGTWLAYTGLGSAATAAVGLVQLAPEKGSPQAMVPGTAYTTLQVDATSAAGNLLFATDAPRGPGKEPGRRVEVRVVRASGPGPALALEGPGGEAHGVSVARNDGGIAAVAFSNDTGVYFARLRCDD